LAGVPVPPPITRWVPDTVVPDAKATHPTDEDDGLFF